MAKPKIIKGSEVKAKPKVVAEETEWDIERPDESLIVNSTFVPRSKDPGDLIMSEDWNNIQTEIKDDLVNLVSAVNNIASKSQFLIASGVSSHGMYIELNWGVKPHILISYSGPLEGVSDLKHPIRCYPEELSEKGFRVYSQSDDGTRKGIVNWIAIGVVQ